MYQARTENFEGRLYLYVSFKFDFKTTVFEIFDTNPLLNILRQSESIVLKKDLFGIIHNIIILN